MREKMKNKRVWNIDYEIIINLIEEESKIKD